jgi:hypothetical protein
VLFVLILLMFLVFFLMLLWYPHHWEEEVTIAHQRLATNQPIEFLSRASATNQSSGRVSLPGLGIVVVGQQTKRPSWFLHCMVRPRPPSACAQGAQKGQQATNRALSSLELNGIEAMWLFATFSPACPLIFVKSKNSSED